jgi:hypothetical protein
MAEKFTWKPQYLVTGHQLKVSAVEGLLKNGLTAPRARGPIQGAYERPNHICFSMMGNSYSQDEERSQRYFWNRYNGGLGHFGPDKSGKITSEVFGISVVVDPSKEVFSDKTRFAAIGSFFHDADWAAELSVLDGLSFGLIPVVQMIAGEHGYPEPFPAEVIYHSRNQDGIFQPILPEAWQAVVLQAFESENKQYQELFRQVVEVCSANNLALLNVHGDQYHFSE